MTQEAQPQSNGHQDLKVVLSIRGDKATIGVQRPLCDPFIETFDKLLIPEELVAEVPGVIARAVARWGEAPQFPKYDRPAPAPAPPRPARQTGRAGKQVTRPASPAPAAPAAQTEQTLRLF